MTISTSGRRQVHAAQRRQLWCQWRPRAFQIFYHWLSCCFRVNFVFSTVYFEIWLYVKLVFAQLESSLSPITDLYEQPLTSTKYLSMISSSHPGQCPSTFFVFVIWQRTNCFTTVAFLQFCISMFYWLTCLNIKNMSLLSIV